MRKAIRSLLVISLAVYLAGSAGAFADEAKEKRVYPEQEILLEGKKPARFGHKVHVDAGMDCLICHHDTDHQGISREQITASEDTSALKCVKCHNDDFKVESLRTKKSIFHMRCKECHKKGYGDKKGPANCKGCHVKTEKK